LAIEVVEVVQGQWVLTGSGRYPSARLLWEANIRNDYSGGCNAGYLKENALLSEEYQCKANIRYNSDSLDSGKA
jgi:hypothetical protein